jgi:hypothetical protein
MQRRLDDGKRPRIGVSLDPDVYEWIKDFNGPSDSYTVSRILRAAMLAGLTLDEAQAGGVLEDFSEWLSRKRSKFAGELHGLIDEYLADK